MSAYTTQALIESYIPPAQLIAAMSDDGDTNTLNTVALNAIIQNVSTDIDGALANIYNVPFTGTIPAKVSAAALVFACEAIYQRTITPNDKNPFTEQAKRWRDEMVRIGKGEIVLDVNVDRAFDPGAAILDPLAVDMTTA